MQKKIIAVAVAALASTAAFAQTNVTVYGVIDVQQSFVKSNGGYEGTVNTGIKDGPIVGGVVTKVAATSAVANQRNTGRLDSHGNYIGFKGVEDLGNGLKAVFVYETAFSADTGAGLTGTRDAYVGVAGNFGTVAAGQLTHPLRAFGAKVELLPGAAGFGTTASVTGTLLGVKTGADDRASNAVAYISPAFSGFTGVVAYVNGENNTKGYADGALNSAIKATTAGDVVTATGAQEGINGRQWQIAGQYDNGPLFVGVGYHKAKAFGLSTTLNDGAADYILSGFSEPGQDARVIRVAASYTLPSNTKLTALYDNTKLKLGETGQSIVGADNIKRAAFSLGVAQSFGKNTVGLEYARALDAKVGGSKADETGSRIITAMYGYELSKRTMLHARYSRLSNDAGVNANFYNVPVGQGTTTGVGSDYTGFSVGVRHSF